MLRTVGDQPALWKAVFPRELLVLPYEFTRVDAWWNDPAFFAPFASFFDPLPSAFHAAPDDYRQGTSVKSPLAVRSRTCVAP